MKVGRGEVDGLSGFGLQRFKMMVECMEQSVENQGWRFDPRCADPYASLAGRWVGMAIRHRLYSKKDGSDARQLDLDGCYSIQQIQSGQYELHPDKDDRKNPSQQAAAPAAQTADEFADVPF